MTMIEVYGYPQTRSVRITWMLEELEQAYDYKLVDFTKGEIRQEPFISINPAGKVPALKDGNLLLLESAAIVAYLGDKFPDKNLVPRAGTTQRGIYDQWSYFTACELEQPLWTIGKNKFALPKELRVPAIFSTAEWEYQKALKLLSLGLDDKPYILGDAFSAADILLGHTLDWGTRFKQAIEQENLIAYAERLNERPALARARKTEAAGST
jgi:glutathione S-transferase